MLYQMMAKLGLTTLPFITSNPWTNATVQALGPNMYFLPEKVVSSSIEVITGHSSSAEQSPSM
jgi:hypothetical protein